MERGCQGQVVKGCGQMAGRLYCTKYQGFDDDGPAGFLGADSLTTLKATWIRKLISRLLSSLYSNPFHFSSQSFLGCLYQWPRTEEKSSQRGAEEKL